MGQILELDAAVYLIVSVLSQFMDVLSHPSQFIDVPSQVKVGF